MIITIFSIGTIEVKIFLQTKKRYNFANEIVYYGHFQIGSDFVCNFNMILRTDLNNKIASSRPIVFYDLFNLTKAIDNALDIPQV